MMKQILSLKVSAFVCGVAMAFVAGTAQATTRYWTGGGADAKASTAENWLSDKDDANTSGAPVAGDVVVFDDTGAEKPCSWDLDVKLGSWTQDGYTNVVTIATVCGSTGFTALEITGSVNLQSGTWTHLANGQSQTYCLNAIVGGNFTVGSKAKVTAYGRGYVAKYAPTGQHGYSATSHGGQGWRSGTLEKGLAAYGSIVNPMTIGAGSNTCPGGGLVKLTVAGTLTVDGEVSANGDGNGDYNSGAGGSVNITAAKLLGEGKICADSPNARYSSTEGTSGGGRVAVALTDAAATFSAHWFKNITAHGQWSWPSVGGAGTVLLRSRGQTADEGHLVLRNFSASDWGQRNSNSTPVGGAIDGTTFGNVSILERAKLNLQAGSTLTVNGSWTNSATFASGANSTVVFAGSGEANVHGNNTFANLSCATEGKSIVFTAGSVQTVTGVLSVAGGTTENTFVTLKSSGSANWQLKASNASCVLSGVALGGCTSDTALTILNGKDLGGNSANITFVTISPGETITWTGAAGSSWANVANWDRNRAPYETDLVVIPQTDLSPILDVNASVAGLSVSSGASLALGANTLSIGGTAQFLGTLTGASGAALELSGDLALGGTVSMSGGTIAFVGSAARTVSFTTSSPLPTLTFAEAAYALSGDLNCEECTVAAGASLTFAAGEKVIAKRFVVNGSATKSVMLDGTSTWSLSVLDSVVDYARVRNSDASAGLMIVSATSTDLGGNENWVFEDTRAKWIGGASGDFSEASNWSTGKVPGSGDDVLVTGAANVTLASGATASVKSLSLGTGARFVVNGALSVLLSVIVADGATLEWNTHGTIGKNLVMLSGSTMTHATNGTYRIDLEIDGDGLVQAGAKIDVKGCGYGRGAGPAGSWSGFNGGGTHGGRGYPGSGAKVVGFVGYDSIVAPTNCGCTGGSGFSTAHGGGAVSLDIAGDLTFLGEIDADGGVNADCYGAAGGSARIVARHLSGSGSIHARGGQILKTSNADGSGGGGRVSIVLTGGDFSNWTGTTTAYGGYYQNATGSQTTMGSAGTVYLKAADASGKLLIQNIQRYDTRYDATDLPPQSYCLKDETAGMDVEVGNYATLNLASDAEIGSLTLSGDNHRIVLNGHVLKVKAITKRKDREKVEAIVKPYKLEYYCTGKAADQGDAGRIDWYIPGLAILVK